MLPARFLKGCHSKGFFPEGSVAGRGLAALGTTSSCWDCADERVCPMRGSLSLELPGAAPPISG